MNLDIKKKLFVITRGMLLYKISVVLFIVLFHTISYSAKPLHILFVVGHFPSPSQIFILNIITGLIDQGHKVSIFSFHQDPFVNMHPNIKKYSLLKHVMYKNFPAKLPKCDIVFCQFGYLGQRIFEMSRLSAWLKERKVVVCLRGSDLTAHLKQNPTRYKRLFKRANLILPVCGYFRKKLIKLGCKHSKTVVYHSAIDCSQFSFTSRKKPDNNHINFVSVSRLVKKKGLDDAIQAFAEIVRKYPKAHYFIVGDGTERTYLELLVYQLNLQDNITFCGWKSHKEIVSILNKSHIFMLPSKKASDGNEEGIANALKEAMAMGLISVSTWHAGTSELIDHGESGFLVAEDSVTELTHMIDYIINHPELWESVGLAARKKVEDEFETKKSIEKLESLFYGLLRQ